MKTAERMPQQTKRIAVALRELDEHQAILDNPATPLSTISDARVGKLFWRGQLMDKMVPLDALHVAYMANDYLKQSAAKHKEMKDVRKDMKRVDPAGPSHHDMRHGNDRRKTELNYLKTAHAREVLKAADLFPPRLDVETADRLFTPPSREQEFGHTAVVLAFPTHETVAPIQEQEPEQALEA